MKLSKPVPWKQLAIAAAAGFSVLWLFEAWFYRFPLSDVGMFMFALCPPSLILMAAEHTGGFELFKLLVMVSAANALIYSIVIATVLEVIAAVRKIPSR